MKMISAKHKAFTLVEILIALSIFTVVVFGALQVFNFIQTNSAKNEEKIARLREVQLAVRQIEDDIRHLVPRERRNQYADKEPLLKSQSDSVTSYLEFTRANWRNPAKLPRSSLQHLKYELIDDTLVRHHWLYVDNAMDEQQLTRKMLTDIESLKFEFMQTDDWKDEWAVNGDNSRTVPRAIKVTIKLPDFGEIYRIFPMPELESIAPTNASPDNSGRSK